MIFIAQKSCDTHTVKGILGQERMTLVEKSHCLAFEFQTDFCTRKAETVVLESVSECLWVSQRLMFLPFWSVCVKPTHRLGA